MRVALVHDWLTGMRGGEKVLQALMELFPEAHLFTLVFLPEKVSPVFQSQRVTVSPLQRLPFGRSHYRYYLPLYYEFMKGFDFSEYDLIISSSSACAKWIQNPKKRLHICYCHTPMRYIWDGFEEYFGSNASLPVRWMARAFREYLQRCDLKSNEGVSYFIANSSEVRHRIQRLYHREATVIHPPVELAALKPESGERTYYLVVSALVPYKRIDLAIQGCNKKNLPLRIIGDGPERKRLENMSGPTIQFEGWVPSEKLAGYYSHAKALIFPGREDFGIVPVEALSCGCPVIAFQEGGVQDTLTDGVTGVLFREQTVASLVEAIEKFSKMPFPDMKTLRKMMVKFSTSQFLFKMKNYIRKIYQFPPLPSSERP